MPRIRLIVNPTAGKGAAGRMLPQIQELLRQAQGDYDLQQTERPGHAIELAQQAAREGCQVVAAVGGDGTLNEVINGLMAVRAAGGPIPTLGIMPVGRGNDFAFSMGVDMDLAAGCYALTNGGRRRIDIGKLTGGFFPEGRYFGNGIGIGFDAMVNYEAARMRFLSGFSNYFAAMLKSLIVHFKAPLVEIDCDGQTTTRRTMMISVMNGRRLGGGFLVAPNGQADDGLFDVSIIRSLSRPAAFGLIPRFINGTQLSHPAVQFSRVRRLRVRAIEGYLPAHGDGEMFSLNGSQLEIEIIPDTLELITAR